MLKSTMRKRKFDEIPCKRHRMESLIEINDGSENIDRYQNEDEQSLDDEDL